MIALTCDPDGSLDERNPSDKVELTVGVRNPVTGLTRISGQLDDLGVEVLGQATDGLATPQPARGWFPGSAVGGDPPGAGVGGGAAPVPGRR